MDGGGEIMRVSLIMWLYFSFVLGVICLGRTGVLFR